MTVGVNKDCCYCGRSVTCNTPNCTLNGHTCRWNGDKSSYAGESYDCRIWASMLSSNIPCYKHLEYYSKKREWEMWYEWDYFYQNKLTLSRNEK